VVRPLRRNAVVEGGEECARLADRAYRDRDSRYGNRVDQLLQIDLAQFERMGIVERQHRRQVGWLDRSHRHIAGVIH
jgi:hypothetical protein